MSGFDAVLVTPVGNLGVELQDKSLSRLMFLAPHIVPIPYCPQKGPTAIVAKWLEYYFQNPKETENIFSLPFILKGTPFQKKIWQRLAKIPVGNTITYGELANDLNTHPRAVGAACRSNPIPLIIPCHRVISKKGIGGYMGQVMGERLAIKEWLLAHEAKNCPSYAEEEV